MDSWSTDKLIMQFINVYLELETSTKESLAWPGLKTNQMNLRAALSDRLTGLGFEELEMLKEKVSRQMQFATMPAKSNSVKEVSGDKQSLVPSHVVSKKSSELNQNLHNAFSSVAQLINVAIEKIDIASQQTVDEKEDLEARVSNDVAEEKSATLGI